MTEEELLGAVLATILGNGGGMELQPLGSMYGTTLIKIRGRGDVGFQAWLEQTGRLRVGPHPSGEIHRKWVALL